MIGARADVQRKLVVTGAAGALGQAAVRHFIESGARVALVHRNLISLIQSFPDLDLSRHLYCEADVTSASAMSVVADQIYTSFGTVTAVVHIVGGFEMGPSVHELDHNLWDRLLNLNAWPFVSVVRSFAPGMIKAGAGAFVAVSVSSANRGLADMSAYCASKSALQRVVESAAAELGPLGIRADSIAPGMMDTRANRRAMPKADHSRWLPLEWAVDAIDFLADGRSRGVNGQHLVVVLAGASVRFFLPSRVGEVLRFVAKADTAMGSKRAVSVTGFDTAQRVVFEGVFDCAVLPGHVLKRGAT